MMLEIKVEDQKCILSLVDGGTTIDSEVFAFDRSLSEQLIVKLDKIFARSRIDKTTLKEVKLVGNIDKNTTNYKLLLAFKKGLVFAN